MQVSLAKGVCWGCAIASTLATAQLHFYIILQRFSETRVRGSVVLNLEREVLKFEGKLFAKGQGGRHVVVTIR